METLSSLPERDLARFLERQQASAALRPAPEFGLHLQQILDKASQLVPSESGSVLLDDPLRKVADRAHNDLTFVAAFGDAADALIGQVIPASQGVVGQVYRTGRPHLSRDVEADQAFSPDMDHLTGHRTQSLVAVPISIGSAICGVIELVNRRDRARFDERDLALLEVFASYTSSALLNALDARRAHDLARRDDLSGLSNDRWLHHSLVEMLAGAAETGAETSVIFMDLDGLKSVNDRFGHLAGSQVLREVGFLLRRLVQDEAAVLARYGGDEFVVVLPDTSLETAAGLAETIRSTIAESVFVERAYASLPALHLRGVISGSLGVASERAGREPAPPHLRESDLLRRADAALYEAKARGKNQVVRAPEELAGAGSGG